MRDIDQQVRGVRVRSQHKRGLLSRDDHFRIRRLKLGAHYSPVVYHHGDAKFVVGASGLPILFYGYVNNTLVESLGS